MMLIDSNFQEMLCNFVSALDFRTECPMSKSRYWSVPQSTRHGTGTDFLKMATESALCRPHVMR